MTNGERAGAFIKFQLFAYIPTAFTVYLLIDHGIREMEATPLWLRFAAISALALGRYLDHRTSSLCIQKGLVEAHPAVDANGSNIIDTSSVSGRVRILIELGMLLISPIFPQLGMAHAAGCLPVAINNLAAFRDATKT